MSYRDRSKRTPHVKPVTKIELSEKNMKLRLIALVVMLAIAATSLAVGVSNLLHVEPGWQQIEASSDQTNCSSDFILNYYLGASDLSSTEENRLLNSLYTEATENAYRIFSAEVLEDGLYNVGYLNAHVNEAISVDEALYEALELLVRYGNRYGYLAPVYVEYNRVFLADNEMDASLVDPARNPDLMDYIAEVAAFAADPAAIDLELLADGQVCLRVCEAYLEFAETHGIETYFDFNWMTNAFIIDYITDILAENGLTLGYLSSYDGFTRNLDPMGNRYSFNIFDRHENTVYLPATLEYSGALSIVYLRDYPLGETDRWHYYVYEGGMATTTFIDPADGICKSAVNNIVSYSGTLGCAEILMQTAPVFIADNFDADALNALTDAGIYSVWGEDTVLYYNDADLSMPLSTDAMGVTYTKEYALN